MRDVPLVGGKLWLCPTILGDGITTASAQTLVGQGLRMSFKEALVPIIYRSPALFGGLPSLPGLFRFVLPEIPEALRVGRVVFACKGYEFRAGHNC